MSSQPRIPTATYRLQFNQDFTFKQAEEVLPYLEKLGISDVYSSPFYKSRPGSTHGYDVTNHNLLNPALGTEEDFHAFIAALQSRKMGHVTDFVPNHMGITDPGNEWWMDVLENGPYSVYAPFFDIEWDPIKIQLRNKVLLPVLGDQYGRVLEHGDFDLVYKDGAFSVTYYDFVFPVNPETYPQILRIAVDKLSGYSDEDMYTELESIITALDYLAPREGTDIEERVRMRSREKEVVKRRIGRLCSEYPQVGDAIDRALHQLKGRVGNARSFDSLHELLGAQFYRLSYWKVAGEEINYRRFFDVNELAAIRVENPKVFDTIHRLLFQLIENGSITGVRIDHVDGLHDPKKYLQALRHRSMSHADDDGGPADPRFYLVVEKILAEDEKLRTDWPVEGTTGYDFTLDATQLLIDSRHGDLFSRIYRDFIDRYVHFESLIYEKKKLVMDVTLSSDVEALSHQLSDLAERDRMHRDFTLDSLRIVTSELIACFPVYRTYINAATGISESDRFVVSRAIRTAKRRNAAIDTSIFDFLRSILLLENYDNQDEGTQVCQRDFIYKFQQCTGPIMAKGLEDTAFYIFNRLTALNEVGGAPGIFGITVERFHERNRLRLNQTPNTMLTLTTHDTKRSEDVRARLAVLSEMPDEWHTWIDEWHKVNAGAKTEIDNESAPSANEEYLLYQTLLGTWPWDDANVDELYVQRMQRYLLKAIKEAKVNSSWVQPNEEWENAASRFISEILKPEHSFRHQLAAAAQRIVFPGVLNSLSQTILKLTCPGIPDFYQGGELWDFRLVDPDNRGSVDYAFRQNALSEVIEVPLTKLFPQWSDGKIKLAIIHRLLQYRSKHSRLFQSGTYSSLYATGAHKDCCVAFHRKFENDSLLVIVPRLTTRMTSGATKLNWGDTQLLIDESIPAMQDLFTDRKLAKGTDSIALNLFNDFPFAVFRNAGS